MIPFQEDLQNQETIYKLVQSGFDICQASRILEMPIQRGRRLFEKEMLRQKQKYKKYINTLPEIPLSVSEEKMPGESFKKLYIEPEYLEYEFIIQSNV